MAVPVGLHRHVETLALVEVTYDPAEVDAATTAEDTFTLPGVAVGDVVVVMKPTATAGVGIVNARVSAADTVAVTWVNATALAVNPAAEVYRVLWMRFPTAGDSVEGLA